MPLFQTELNGKKLKVEIGQLARQADGAVLVTLGETAVLATCVISKEPKNVNYLPLTVDYQEKFYAAGKIRKTRFTKREFRSSDEAILTARLIDRTIRPLFDSKIRNEIQIIVTPLSFDQENDPDVPALIGASLAISLSPIPWDGPIAGLRLGYLENKFLINPNYSERETGEIDLFVAGPEKRINMLEGQSKEIKEEIFIQAIEFILPHLQKLIDFQKKIIEEYQPSKIVPASPSTDSVLEKRIKDFLSDKLTEIIYHPDKNIRRTGLNQIKEELHQYLQDNNQEELIPQADLILEKEIDDLIHKNILEREKRPDGRKLDEIRPLSCQVGLLPRVHGSGLFQRGDTQVLSTVTLGAPGEEQIIETMETDTTKRFFHHYYFPPYCVGETGPLRGPNRREIGHGALVEKAIQPLLPPQEKFPYTIRVVSEVLSSNGSSSMASVCASSLALFDAGVPIKNSVSGIAMGLIYQNDENYKILTDIQGPEDHHGDMDFKIAGTKNGLTACQMDVKIKGITLDIIKNTLKQARKAHFQLFEEMNKTIPAPRENLSPYAPRILTIQVNPDKIRNIIGPQGKTINEIIDQTGVKIDIEENGLVYVTSEDKESAQKALEWIKNLTREIKVGEIFKGRVTRIADFGAFVEILPGHEGLVHISELAPRRIKKVEEVVKVGDIIPVKVKSIDEMGRISLSLKEAQTQNYNNRFSKKHHSFSHHRVR